MQPSEAAAVLTAAAIVDKRTIGETDARMWADILPASIGPRVAVEAVKAYYREHREMVMPADVIKYAATARRELGKRQPMDSEAFRNLPTAGHRLIYSREYYEALAGGAMAEEADRVATERLSKSTDADRKAIEPAPDPNRHREW